MKTLYCITTFFGELSVEKVEIVKETEKQYKISANKSYKSVLRKSELNHLHNGTILTFDLKYGLEKLRKSAFNSIEKTKSRLSKYEREFEELKKSIEIILREEEQ